MFGLKKKKIEVVEEDFKINWEKYSSVMNTEPPTEKELAHAMKVLRDELLDNKDTDFEGGAIIELRSEVIDALADKLLENGHSSSLLKKSVFDSKSFPKDEKNYYTKRLVIANTIRIFDLLCDPEIKYTTW